MHWRFFNEPHWEVLLLKVIILFYRGLPEYEDQFRGIIWDIFIGNTYFHFLKNLRVLYHFPKKTV